MERGMNQGVGPSPAANSGSSSSQPTAGAPAQNEAQQAESRPFGASASGAVPKEDRVPKERFQEVYNRMKEAEARLAQTERPAPAPQTTRPGYDEQIAGWRDVATKAFGQDPQEFTNALNQMSALQAKAAASEVMEQFLRHQTEQSAVQNFTVRQEQSWKTAVEEFPELRDQSSEFYQNAASLWIGDEILQADPDGMYKAAEIAFGRRARKGGFTPPKLEGSKSQPMQPGKSDDFASEYSGTINALKGGNKLALQNFLAKNMDKILYRDSSPRP